MQQLRRTLIAWLGAALAVGVVTLPSSAVVQADSTWMPGPNAAGDNTYAGFVDAPSANATVPTGSFVVNGWFVDKTAQGWAGADDVQVFQGTMDGGGKMLAKATIGQNRPDVAAALGSPLWAGSGFTAVVPPDSLAPGAQTLSVYAHTPDKGWWYTQVPVNVSTPAAAAPAPGPAASSPPAGAAPGSVPQNQALVVAFEQPTDGEILYTRNTFEISGYALDRNATPSQGVSGSGVNRVQVYIGNDRTNGGIYLGDADLGYTSGVADAMYGQPFGYSGWRLTFMPTQFHANSYTLYAYARSAVTGMEDQAQRLITIHE